MVGRFRALFVVVVLAVGAIAATAYLGYHRGLMVGARPGGVEVASASVNGSIFGGDSDSALLGAARDDLETRFYKPVNPQTPITGEAQALSAYLKKHGVAHPQLPSETANGDAAHDTGSLASILAFAQKRYDARLASNTASSDLTAAALSGILDSVHDRWTVYLPPHEIAQLDESLAGGDFGGIGVYIEQLKDLRIIVVPIDDMPAAESGLKPGDVVDAVDGVSTHDLSLDRVEQLIRGPSGSAVTILAHALAPIKAKQPAQHTYRVVRAIIHVPSVSKKMVGRIDYIRLADFGETSAAEIRSALLFGKTHHADGYILDLRNNGGGLVNAAVDISSLFIPQGPIVSTIKRDGSKTTLEANGDAISGVKPLVVLVNGYTASASEITAGALQDYHLATIIGTKTFGKGVVQSIYAMPNNGALKITTARYVTPLGRDIQHRGIVPDVIVPDPNPMLIDTKADPQLAAAKARLHELLR